MLQLGKSRFTGKRIGLIFFFIALVSVQCIAFSWANEEQGKSPDVLVIYSTGTPFSWTVIKSIAKRSDKNVKEIDAITSPTPLKENCGTIAEKLASALRDKKLIVRVAETMEIKHRDEILRARLVVIGSPAYFANVSWKIKKLFDEQFHRIYLLEKKRLAKRRIAAFAMAEIEPSARSALKAIKAVVRDCKGRFGPTMIFLTKHSKKEIRKRINQLAQELAGLIEHN